MISKAFTEQSIATFSRIDLPAAVTAAPRLANVASNTNFRDGRIYVLLLDDINVHPLALKPSERWPIASSIARSAETTASR